MDADGLIDHLGYRDAAGFLDASRWDEAIEHAHVFRHTAEACEAPRVGGRFRGIYMLGMRRPQERHATTPVVYVAEAPDAEKADAIHHLVWNQGVVPFLLVHTPQGVRLYSGFDYEPSASFGSAVPRSQQGVLDAAIAFDQVADKLAAFRAQSVDDGGLWAHWGARIDPSRRVDVRLLSQLAKLGELLREQGLEQPVAHALIGRFVYLRYLRERGILSDSLLKSWDIDPGRDFGREIRARAFRALLAHVDERLNGSIFPLALSGPRAPSIDHIRAVASAMLGDDLETGQLHLSFRAYDFSHIPVETLSAIYEQFLSAEGRSRTTGAFYTPVPLVNFVLGELDDLCPLRPGMRVFDPACGSGAFLVQCFQLLIEKWRREAGRSPSARELRELLVTHIFGMDSDEEACRVTEFSLALALLDQIPAETLTRLHNFKLPDLHGNNIIHGDFFDAPQPGPEGAFDWMVGNPPWVPGSSSEPSHRPALGWIQEHKKSHPVSGNQLAEAFAWRAPDLLRPGGIAALVMPATTLFKEQKTFRERFFAQVDVKAVVNLTNLREVLFEGRARTPAAVLFYAPRKEEGNPAEDVAVYSPLVVNQEAIRPPQEGERRAAWTITVDHSEVRLLSRREVVDGDPLPWKLSMWGSPRDARLLRSIAQRFPSLEKAAVGRWSISEGLPLRNLLDQPEELSGRRPRLVPLPEVRGELELSVSSLRNTRHVHSLPASSLNTLPASRAYARRRGGTAGLAICRPPHVIVHEARGFAVFSDEFLIVPPPQIGIAGGRAEAPALRALALYLVSSFAWYQQFLSSPQMDSRGVSTINALKRLPVPLASLDAQVATWVEIHEQMVALSDQRWAARERGADQTAQELEAQMAKLEQAVNDLTCDALGLTPRDRWLVDDLVNVRRHLADGKIGDVAAGRPTRAQLEDYALALRDELDLFLDRGRRFRHGLTVVHEARAGMVQIVFSDSPVPQPLSIEPADSIVGLRLRSMRDRIDREHGQWLYFDRNLVMYHDGRAFLSKPMQRFWWTRSQALADADRIIADLVAAGGAA